MNNFSLCLYNEPYLLPISMVPSLVYYSHSLLIFLCIITIIIIHRNNSDQNLLYTLLLSSIALRLLFSLLNWISNIPEVTMLSWSLTILSEVMIYLCSIGLMTSYIQPRFITYKHITIILLIILPIIILLPSEFTLVGFNMSDCSSIEGPIATYYVYFIEILFIIYSVYILIKDTVFRHVNKLSNRTLIPHGIPLFLVIFTTGNVYGSITKNWVYGDIGLISIPLLIYVFLYSIIKHRALETNFDDKKILLVISWVLLASLITIDDVDLLHLVILITLLVIILLSMVIFTITSRESLHLSKISSLASSLKDLNDNLEAKVTAQTAEIKKSYEIEQNAHRELVKLSDAKDSFISIAQHNLRIPITNINNKIENLIKDSNNLDGATKAILTNTKESLDNLNEIADEFRNISKIKRGSQILQPTKETILPIISNIINELSFEIDRLNISITYPILPESWPIVHIDKNKIKDALIVVIENAIKYNVNNGYIKISNRVEGNKFIILIKNSGLGLSKQEKENQNRHNFYRSERVKNVNPVGMGIGLYLAKSIIEAHHGNLSISSDGENLGATVEITIPIDFLKQDK